MYRHGLELRSKITSGGFLELFVQETPVPEPAADEIVIRIEAAPLNPSDIILLLGPAADMQDVALVDGRHRRRFR